jgi:thiamine-monophosphate kinase
MNAELDFINNIKLKYDLRSIGDDCAIIHKDEATDLLITTDLLAEDIDFRIDWTDPYLLGRRSLSVSLSDIAAMGASPKWALLSLAVPDRLWDQSFLERFYDGWHSQANKFDVELVGGDISRSADKLLIDSIVGGEVEKGKAILRSGARVGDLVFVSGELGGAGGGLRLLKSGVTFDPHRLEEAPLIARQLDPSPQIELGIFLSTNSLATASIDISDGLSTELFHICGKSGVGAEINAGQLPVDPELRRSFPENEALDLALNGGEDFQLLFTVPPDKEACLKGFPCRLTKIGTIRDASEGIKLIFEGGASDLPPGGYSHF